MPRNQLIVTVGVPRSGKSTWVKNYLETDYCPVVSLDSIRLAIHGQRFLPSAEPYVWATAKTMVPALFGAGHDTIIVDSCSTTYGQRKQWCSPNWDTLFMVLKTDLNICKDRALKDGMSDLLQIIDRMAQYWEDLREDEEHL